VAVLRLLCITLNRVLALAEQAMYYALETVQQEDCIACYLLPDVDIVFCKKILRNEANFFI
jgi:hypothetical protein